MLFDMSIRQISGCNVLSNFRKVSSHQSDNMRIDSAASESDPPFSLNHVCGSSANAPVLTVRVVKADAEVKREADVMSTEGDARGIFAEASESMKIPPLSSVGRRR